MLGSNDRFSIYTGTRELCLRNIGDEIYCSDESGDWWLLSEIVSSTDQKIDCVSNDCQFSYLFNYLSDSQTARL